MQIQPNVQTIKEYANCGKYDIFPVSAEILSDICTPIEAVKIMKNHSTHCFILESVANDEKWGRYTFLGFDPKTQITALGSDLTIGDIVMTSDDPSVQIRQLLSNYRSPRLDYLPPFTGGLVGYFSYDYLSYSEKLLRTNITDTEKFNDVDLMLFDKLIAFDHYKQKIILIVNMKLSEGESGYNKAVLELNQLSKMLIDGNSINEPSGHMTSDVSALFGKEEYCQMVEKAKKHIIEGDIFQIVLSNRFSADFEGSLMNTYRVLRTLNPSPYMFYFSGTDVEIAGASPETLVKLENGILHTFPLAGTRPRGKTEQEDKELEKELLSDEKELAEHNMLLMLCTSARQSAVGSTNNMMRSTQ